MESSKANHLKLVDPSLRQSSGEIISPDLSESLRNLMGLLALPGLWVGRSGQTILRLTFEAIERTVPIRFIYSKVQLEPHTTYSLLMWDRFFESDEQLIPWESDLNLLLNDKRNDALPYERTLRGESLKLIELSLGFGAVGGKVWLGSPNPNFPSLADLTFIRAAITLAGTGLLTAKAHQEAERANRAKDEFMAILGHELRNPLAPIMMSLDVLKRKNHGELPKELHVINRQSKHLAQLVDDLLDVSRITTGKVVLKNDLVNLNEVITRAIENCTPLLNEKRHHLTKSLLMDNEAFVRGDTYRLIQIFTNLLNNAAKFMGAGGQLNITPTANNEMIEVSIEDNGPGISADLLPTIFNMFEQGKQTIERSKGGLGIGLSVVKSLVELHHGRIQVESEEKHGAKFTVILPLALYRVTEEETKQPMPLTIASKKILLVDDNEDAVLTLAEYLELTGYSTATSMHPDEALDLIHTFEPDVIILDIGLPGMSGYELATKIKQAAKNHPLLIALTGYGQEKDKIMSKNSGFDVHLTKPISFDLLEDALSKLSN